MTHFVEGTDCFKSATPELFEASARAFGRFQYMLQGYPAETLHETIAKFHDTEDRLRKLKAAINGGPLIRVAKCKAEIDFVLAREKDCSVALQALREGKLPLRVTHNDTKLNNILIDRATGEGICVIDLDTTMPGLSINDFGESIRFGANHSAEDEKDLSKVNFDIELYEVYTMGCPPDDSGMWYPILNGLSGRGSLFPYPLSGSESGSLPDPVQTCPRYGRAI